MKGCLLNNIESVKTACLKHIEFIFENIGCSIGNSYIPRAIQALIHTYPQNNSCNFVKRRAATNEFPWLPVVPPIAMPPVAPGRAAGQSATTQSNVAKSSSDAIARKGSPWR